MASIEKRSENSYRITVSTGYDGQGKQVKKQKTIKLDPKLTEKQKEKELERHAILFQEEVDRGTYLDADKLTFGQFISKWLKDYAEPNLAPKTLYRYKELLDTRIIPALGHIKLAKLQPTHLTAFYNNLREDGIRSDGKPGGLSESTILHHHRLISAMLTAAVQWQLILINPAERVKPPSPEKKEAKHFNEAQTDYILQLMEAEPLKYRTMINLAVYGGMRLGELAGLEWNDVDMENNLIRIQQAGQYIPTEGVYTKSPKNESSKRIISLPATVISVLRQYKLWQNGQKAKLGDNLWVDSGRIFTKWSGEPMFPDTPSKWFHKFIKRHNAKIMNDERISKEDKPKYLLPEVNFHGLRHTNATLLIGQGVDVTTVSSRLGHARTSTTTDIYAHALKKPDIEAANKLENMFKKKNNSENSRQA